MTSRASAKSRRQHTYYTRLQRKLYQLVAGGGAVRCEICGYDASVAALHLHHPDPTVKMRKFNQRNWSPKDLDDPSFVAEARACRIFCANCHAEYHAGETVYELFVKPFRAQKVQSCEGA